MKEYFEQLAEADLSKVKNKKLVAETNDALSEYREALSKGNQTSFFEIYGEVGKALWEKVDASIKKAEKPLRKVNENAPSREEAYKFFDKVRPTFNLHLPFHESISQGEKDRIAQEMAQLFCAQESCYPAKEKLIGYAQDWLEKANKKALSNAKKENRKEFSTQEGGDIKEQCDAIRLKTKRSTPSQPRPKKQFGTQIIEKAEQSIKKAAAKRKKEGGDMSKVSQDLKKVERAGKSFLQALYEFSGQKASSDIIERFEKSIQELTESLKPKEETKPQKPKSEPKEKEKPKVEVVQIETGRYKKGQGCTYKQADYLTDLLGENPWPSLTQVQRNLSEEDASNAIEALKEGKKVEFV